MQKPKQSLGNLKNTTTQTLEKVNEIKYKVDLINDSTKSIQQKMDIFVDTLGKSGFSKSDMTNVEQLDFIKKYFETVKALTKQLKNKTDDISKDRLENLKKLNKIIESAASDSRKLEEINEVTRKENKLSGTKELKEWSEKEFFSLRKMIASSKTLKLAKSDTDQILNNLFGPAYLVAKNLIPKGSIKLPRSLSRTNKQETPEHKEQIRQTKVLKDISAALDKSEYNEAAKDKKDKKLNDSLQSIGSDVAEGFKVLGSGLSGILLKLAPIALIAGSIAFLVHWAKDQNDAENAQNNMEPEERSAANQVMDENGEKGPKDRDKMSLGQKVLKTASSMDPVKNAISALTNRKGSVRAGGIAGYLPQINRPLSAGKALYDVVTGNTALKNIYDEYSENIDAFTNPENAFVSSSNKPAGAMDILWKENMKNPIYRENYQRAINAGVDKNRAKYLDSKKLDQETRKAEENNPVNLMRQGFAMPAPKTFEEAKKSYQSTVTVNSNTINNGNQRITVD